MARERKGINVASPKLWACFPTFFVHYKTRQPSVKRISSVTQAHNVGLQHGWSIFVKAFFRTCFASIWGGEPRETPKRHTVSMSCAQTYLWIQLSGWEIYSNSENGTCLHVFSVATCRFLCFSVHSCTHRMLSEYTVLYWNPFTNNWRKSLGLSPTAILLDTSLSGVLLQNEPAQFVS